MSKLTFITPCTRPGNLPSIEKHIPYGVDWFIVYDLPAFHSPMPALTHQPRLEVFIQGGIYGNHQRNCALEILRHSAYDGWVYFLDDDTVPPAITPELIASLEASGYRGAIIPQSLPGGETRKNTPETVKKNIIDMGQFILHIGMIDREFQQVYESDGILIEDIYARHPKRFVFLDYPISHYNALRS